MSFVIQEKYKKYHWDINIIDLHGHESFLDVPDNQKCGPIEITYGIPNTILKFPLEGGLMSLKFLSWKISPGLHKFDVEIYVNNKKFEYDPDNYEEYIDNYLKLLLKDNIIVIQFKEIENIEYTRHIIIYPIRYKDDLKYYEEELIRWKKKYKTER